MTSKFQNQKEEEMGNLDLFLGNLDPLSWISFGVKYFAEGGGEPEPTPEPTPEPEPKPTPSAFDSLSDDVRGNASMVRFKDSEEGFTNSVAKGYISLEKKIGAKGLIVPGENATQAEKDEFAVSLGRPKDIAGYGEFNLPEGTDKRIQVDQNMLKSFKEAAFKMGLSPENANALLEFDTQRQVAALKELDVLEKQEKDEAETKLRGELGNAYPERMAIAKKVVERFAGNEEDKKALYDAVGNNPRVARLLINVGSKISEDVLGETGHSRMTLTPAEANAKIAAIRANPNHAHNDDTNPLHKEALLEMTTLYKQAHPPKAGS